MIPVPPLNTGAHTQLPQRAPGCGCIGHPAFPAPSDFLMARNCLHNPGVSRRGIAQAHLELPIRNGQSATNGVNFRGAGISHYGENAYGAPEFAIG